jgi:hypothetical protein
MALDIPASIYAVREPSCQAVPAPPIVLVVRSARSSEPEPGSPSRRGAPAPRGPLKPKNRLCRFPAARFHLPARFFAIRTAALLSRPSFWRPAPSSFFPDRHPGFGDARLSIWSVIFLPEPPSRFRSAHPSPGSVIRALEAAIFLPRGVVHQDIRTDAYPWSDRMNDGASRSIVAGILNSSRIKP